MRYVLVCFVFLGWAFFELSGGARFEPRGVRASRMQVATETLPAATGLAPASGPASDPASGPASELVAKPAIAPRKVKPEPGAAIAADATDTDASEPTGRTEGQAATRTPQVVRSSMSQGLRLFATADTNGMAFASLDGEVLSLGQIAAQSSFDRPAPDPAPDPAPPRAAARAAPASDIREVTGTRVNMRDGPGTIYPVIERLSIGQEVEVLSNSGTGWLRLRTVGSQQVGWASASLIGRN